ncbi:hypothetical protein [Myxococcus sp. CA040A]|uniref:hypothetical protein n=1 Tax=Myxococcus sp. CA040A TaxID=2741738 RepID=UPI00157B59A7|nr:hypothetical protein [Myxococcus sp. CA040A]NTX04577.1 hypothetical protein [Myxococcus sp. CA040A]
MSRIVELWDAWSARQTHAGLGALFGAEPLSREQLERYEAAFWRRGFELRGDLRELLEARGLVWVSPIELDDGDEAPGLRLLSAPRLLDEHDRHLELAELNGVPRAEQWMLFTTERDLEPAWALDARFGGMSGPSVGQYHQDLVCTQPVGPTEPLPLASPDVHSWLAERLQDIEARWRSLPREGLEQRMPPPSGAESFEAQQAAALTAAEARIARGGLRWEKLDVDWRRVASGTRDTALLQRVLEGVRQDRRRGRPGIPFDLMAQGVAWPWDYPGPGQLAARLDEPERRKLMGWALERAGARSLGGEGLRSALDTLHSGSPGSRDLLRQVSLEGWTERAINLTTAGGRGRLLARAAALAMSDPTENNVERVLTLCACVGAGTHGAWNLLDAWDHLDAVLNGRTLPGVEARLTPAVPDSALVTELRAWLLAHPGPQRKLAEELGTEWALRLSAASPVEHEPLTRLLKSALKSPKLTGELAALLARLN